jgi:hypothetical protein
LPLSFNSLEKGGRYFRYVDVDDRGSDPGMGRDFSLPPCPDQLWGPSIRHLGLFPKDKVDSM